MNKPLTIRTERATDFEAIRSLVKAAFAKAEHTDGDEHNLIERLRKSGDYIPALSMVAEINGEIAGHIMFSRIYIGDTEAVALAPLAVLPKFQNRGIGRALIHSGHKAASEMGYCCSVVLGDPGYYAKSGYRPAAAFGIKAPFDVPQQFYMVYPFVASVPDGTVRYSEAFML